MLNAAKGIFVVLTILLMVFFMISGIAFDTSSGVSTGGAFFIALVISVFVAGIASMAFLVSPLGSIIAVAGTVLGLLWTKIFGAGIIGGFLLITSWLLAGVVWQYDSTHTRVRIKRGMWYTQSNPEKATGHRFDQE